MTYSYVTRKIETYRKRREYRRICKVVLYEACPESKDTKVLNMYNIFNLQKRHCE